MTNENETAAEVIERIRADVMQRYYPAPAQQAIWEACRDLNTLLRLVEAAPASDASAAAETLATMTRERDALLAHALDMVGRLELEGIETEAMSQVRAIDRDRAASAQSSVGDADEASS